MLWHIVTGEYPPQPGGVSDYTRILAEKLTAAGDEVHIWTPAVSPPRLSSAHIIIHELPGRFGLAALSRLQNGLVREKRPFRLLIQYVPQMYGWRGMNLAFAWRMRSLHRLKPWVMFHEVAVSTDRGQTFKRKILGHAQHMMVRWVASAAAKRWVSIPGWEAYLGLIAPAFGACEWLPVPSNVATHADPLRVAALRNSLAPDSTSRIVAHF